MARSSRKPRAKGLNGWPSQDSGGSLGIGDELSFDSFETMPVWETARRFRQIVRLTLRETIARRLDVLYAQHEAPASGLHFTGVQRWIGGERRGNSGDGGAVVLRRARARTG